MKNFGAEGGTRTPTSYLTRPSNVRVCQFRHFGKLGHYSPNGYFVAAGEAAGAVDAAGDGCCVGSGVGVAVAVGVSPAVSSTEREPVSDGSASASAIGSVEMNLMRCAEVNQRARKILPKLALLLFGGGVR